MGGQSRSDGSEASGCHWARSWGTSRQSRTWDSPGLVGTHRRGAAQEATRAHADSHWDTTWRPPSAPAGAPCPASGSVAAASSSWVSRPLWMDPFIVYLRIQSRVGSGPFTDATKALSLGPSRAEARTGDPSPWFGIPSRPVFGASVGARAEPCTVWVRGHRVPGRLSPCYAPRPCGGGSAQSTPVCRMYMHRECIECAGPGPRCIRQHVCIVWRSPSSPGTLLL